MKTIDDLRDAVVALGEIKVASRAGITPRDVRRFVRTGEAKLDVYHAINRVVGDMTETGQ